MTMEDRTVEPKDSFEILSLPGPLSSGGWNGLLECWAGLIRDYSWTGGTDYPNDVPYWYGERSLTGLLAAAAWRLPGGWSLEEFVGRRKSGRTDASGRGDLWLGLGQSGYTVEAKIVWPTQNVSAAVRDSSEQLADASDQLRSMAHDWLYGTGVAVCYVVPELPSVRPGDTRTLFKRISSGLKRRDRALACYQRGMPFPEADNRVYPGVLLVAEVVHDAGGA